MQRATLADLDELADLPAEARRVIERSAAGRPPAEPSASTLSGLLAAIARGKSNGPSALPTATRTPVLLMPYSYSMKRRPLAVPTAPSPPIAPAAPTAPKRRHGRADPPIAAIHVRPRRIPSGPLPGEGSGPIEAQFRARYDWIASRRLIVVTPGRRGIRPPYPPAWSLGTVRAFRSYAERRRREELSTGAVPVRRLQQERNPNPAERPPPARSTIPEPQQMPRAAARSWDFRLCTGRPGSATDPYILI